MRTLLFLLLTAAILTAGCYDDHHHPPTNNRVEVTHETLPFDRIEVATSSRIRLIQSDRFMVIITGWESDVYDTFIEVRDGRLYIEEHGNIDPEQLIEIFVPDIRQFDLYGSSDVYGETEFRQNGSMEISNYGSGDIDMYADTDLLDAGVYGSGSIFLEGLTDNLDVFISGSGWCKAFGLHSDFTDVRISGSGSAEVFADHDLDVVISGSGDVYFKGHPSIHSEITGSGRLIDAN